jgi:hypothetical protein
MPITTHPAPGSGLGVFLPAYWNIPQNPLALGPGLGQILDAPGIFLYPDNGVIPEILAKQKAAEYLTLNPNGPVGLSCGMGNCGCGATDCGMGSLGGTLDDILGSVTGAMGNWTTWAMVGAGVLALVMFTGGGGSQRSAELASARATYKAKVAGIKAARPRRYQKYV